MEHVEASLLKEGSISHRVPEKEAPHTVGSFSSDTTVKRRTRQFEDHLILGMRPPTSPPVDRTPQQSNRKRRECSLTSQIIQQLENNVSNIAIQSASLASS
jgi:hypothetical protein